MIMEIAGARRRDELCKMVIEDVEDKNSVIIIIPDLKNGMQRSFTIINKNEQRIIFNGTINNPTTEEQQDFFTNKQYRKK